jgi:hypothetical protein
MEQPDYISLYSMGAEGPSDYNIHSSRVLVTVFMSNDTVFNFIPFSTFTMPLRTLMVFPSGFNQLDIWAEIRRRYVDFKVHPTAYHYSLMGITNHVSAQGNPPFEFMILSKMYILDSRAAQSNPIYLAFDNGIGGLEVQYFPNYTVRRESEKNTNERLSAQRMDVRKGRKEEIVGNFADRYSVKTRVIHRRELEVLQRLTHAKIWMIRDGKFERVYAETKTADLPPTYRQFGTFPFVFKKYY